MIHEFGKNVLFLKNGRFFKCAKTNRTFFYHYYVVLSHLKKLPNNDVFVEENRFHGLVKIRRASRSASVLLLVAYPPELFLFHP